MGIGASAGGLEAISELLENLPPKTGMAFVIIQHLDPTHESKIDEILTRKTLMPVKQIKNNVCVKPNHVYVIPPNTNLKILHSRFKLFPRRKVVGQHLPIDFFFTSLAKDQKEKSIGIILSGTASDGTSGLEVVKREGGFTIVQEPKSAKYDGMPRSAIAAEVADLVLPPKKIAIELIRIARHPFRIGEKSSLTPSIPVLAPNEAEGYLTKILAILQNKFHINFSHYKRGTLNRRISRRIILQKKRNLKDYLEYLETHTDEIEHLFADILINVTEFFRDPDAYIALEKKIFPEILKKKIANSPLRIWVVGCATGEEAYSVIMSLMKTMGESADRHIQVFATDISKEAIQKARAGIYHESISKNVSKERLRNFFVKTDKGYKIKDFVREMCLFSLHDVTNTPPFAKLDLICCRNLLIYFDQTLQEKVLPIFHYALKPGGFLWLGRSEGVGKLRSLFNRVDKENKFYISNHIPSRPQLYFPINTDIPEKLEIAEKYSEQPRPLADISREADRIAALKYTPPGIVINNEMEVILIRGEVAPYLQLSEGQASLNFFKIVRPELSSALHMLIKIAKQKNAPSRKDSCILYVDTQLKTFGIDVIPFTFSPASQVKDRYFLISFVPALNAPVAYFPTVKSKNIKQKIDSKDQYIKKLENEVSDVKIYRQSLTQDFEIIQQELTSTNEELQSTVEELETAKEELQSTNEELTIVNDELQGRNIDLVKLSDDLVNFLGSVDIPLVMVGLEGQIHRFTPKAGKLLNLIQSDIGRPISDINPNIDRLDLGSLVSEVIKSKVIKDMSVQDKVGCWYHLQIRPYKATGDRINGAVIVLMDINLLKRDLILSEASFDYVTSIANTVHVPLVVLDKQLRLKSANYAFYKKFKFTARDEGTDFLTLMCKPKGVVSDLRAALTLAVGSNVELHDLEIEFETPSSGHLNMLLNGRRIKWIDKEEPNALLLCIQDITDQLNIEKFLKQAVDQFKKADQAKDIFLATLSHELRTPLTAILCWTQLLIKMDEGSDKLKNGLKAIEQNSKIQGQLIDDLLDVTRIQSGKLALNIIHLDPSEIVRTTVESVRPLAENKSIIIHIHIKLQDRKIAADPGRLQQIIWNLLVNAIKFSPSRKRIDVRLNSVTKNGTQFAAIQVIDQGKGIEPDFLPQLFERFTQADSSTERFHGGLGLGLTIVSDLLKLMGGVILAKSAGVEKGATFTILLPLIPNEPLLAMKSQSNEAAKKERNILPHQNIHGISVLIVEDDQRSLDALNELLSSAGAQTIPVNSAVEALIALDIYKPNILVSDIAMPGKDGISLIQTIRERKPAQGGQIPAIALSAYAAKKDIKRALSAGFNEYLTKPFNCDDLIACIARLVGRRNLSDINNDE